MNMNRLLATSSRKLGCSSNSLPLRHIRKPTWRHGNAPCVSQIRFHGGHASSREADDGAADRVTKEGAVLNLGLAAIKMVGGTLPPTICLFASCQPILLCCSVGLFCFHSDSSPATLILSFYRCAREFCCLNRRCRPFPLRSCHRCSYFDCSSSEQSSSRFFIRLWLWEGSLVALLLSYFFTPM